MVWQAVAGIAGDLLGGILGNSAQSSANRANIRLNKENRDWMERMSNSAYARATADMKSAGLNPMLAYSQGPASTPSNSAAAVEPENALARGVASAGAKAMQIQTLAKLKEETRLTKEHADQAEIDTDEKFATGAAGTASRLRGMHLDMLNKEEEVALKQATRKLNDANVRQRDIETALLEETFGYNVASAKERSELMNREVSFTEARTLMENLRVPEQRAIANWFNAVGAGSPMAKAVMAIGQWISFILRGK